MAPSFVLARPAGHVAIARQGHQLHTAVHIEIRAQNPPQVFAAQGVVLPAILPQAIVGPDLGDRRGRTGQHHDVEIPIGIQVRRRHLHRRADTLQLRRQVTEGAVAVVAEQLGRRVGVGQQQVKIAVVIGIHEQGVHGGKITAGNTHRAGHVGPLSPRQLPPELVGTGTQEIKVRQTIIVVIAPGRAQHTGAAGKRQVRQ